MPCYLSTLGRIAGFVVEDALRYEIKRMVSDFAFRVCMMSRETVDKTCCLIYEVFRDVFEPSHQIFCHCLSR